MNRRSFVGTLRGLAAAGVVVDARALGLEPDRKDGWWQNKNTRRWIDEYGARILEHLNRFV